MRLATPRVAVFVRCYPPFLPVFYTTPLPTIRPFFTQLIFLCSLVLSNSLSSSGSSRFNKPCLFCVKKESLKVQVKVLLKVRYAIVVSQVLDTQCDIPQTLAFDCCLCYMSLFFVLSHTHQGSIFALSMCFCILPVYISVYRVNHY